MLQPAKRSSAAPLTTTTPLELLYLPSRPSWPPRASPAQPQLPPSCLLQTWLQPETAPLATRSQSAHPIGLLPTCPRQALTGPMGVTDDGKTGYQPPWRLSPYNMLLTASASSYSNCTHNLPPPLAICGQPSPQHRQYGQQANGSKQFGKG